MAESKLKILDWRQDETMLIDWYAKLVQSGDLYSTFTPDMRYLSNFLMSWRSKTMAYAIDEQGISFAFWLEPIMSGAFFGCWVREDKRQSPTTLRYLHESINSAFEVATVLLAITKQDRVYDILTKLGCKHAATIPALWSGEDVGVFTMTKDQWELRNRE